MIAFSGVRRVWLTLSRNTDLSRSLFWARFNSFSSRCS